MESPIPTPAAQGIPAAVILFKQRLGLVYVTVDLPVATVFVFLAAVPAEPSHILRRIPEEQPHLMREFPALHPVPEPVQTGVHPSPRIIARFNQ